MYGSSLRQEVDALMEVLKLYKFGKWGATLRVVARSDKIRRTEGEIQEILQIERRVSSL